MSFTLTTGKTDPKKLQLLAIPRICCVLRCKKPAVMSRNLAAVKAWAGLCNDHYGEDGLKLDMDKMVSHKKARYNGVIVELWKLGRTLPPRRRDGEG